MEQSANDTNAVPTPPKSGNANGGKHNTPFWEKLAVLIALGLLIVNIFQMRATQKSANAAKSSAEMEKRTAEKRDEAISRVEGDIAVGSDVFQTFVNNSGNVSARRLSGHVEISLNKLPSNERIRLLTSFDIRPQDIPSQKSLQHFDNTGISHAEWEDIINMHDSLVETSTVQYDNGFDRLVMVPRCYVMVWTPSPNDPNNRAHGAGLDCERLAQWSETNITHAKPQ
ncbi:MAG TPA: hypothetical protein VL913_00685 [Candidatus Micrarchaeaceae archaeon]|nr:hypothetical protein [Candidatus Micrarchaeaceae archaeon]